MNLVRMQLSFTNMLKGGSGTMLEKHTLLSSTFQKIFWFPQMNNFLDFSQDLYDGLDSHRKQAKPSYLPSQEFPCVSYYGLGLPALNWYYVFG